MGCIYSLPLILLLVLCRQTSPHLGPCLPGQTRYQHTCKLRRSGHTHGKSWPEQNLLSKVCIHCAGTLALLQRLGHHKRRPAYHLAKWVPNLPGALDLFETAFGVAHGGSQDACCQVAHFIGKKQRYSQQRCPCSKSLQHLPAGFSIGLNVKAMTFAQSCSLQSCFVWITYLG